MSHVVTPPLTPNISLTERYGPAGNVYDKYQTTNPIARALVQGFLRSFDALSDRADAESVLEVGCGEGELLGRLLGRRSFERAAGCDVDTHVVQLARQKAPQASLALGSIEQLPYPDRSFDLVVACEVLEHVHNPFAALRELARVTRRWVLVSVPREPIWRALNLVRGKYVTSLGNTPGHIQHWSSRRFYTTVATTLQVIEIRRPLPWTMILAEKPRAEEWNSAWRERHGLARRS